MFHFAAVLLAFGLAACGNNDDRKNSGCMYDRPLIILDRAANECYHIVSQY